MIKVWLHQSKTIQGYPAYPRISQVVDVSQKPFIHLWWLVFKKPRSIPYCFKDQGKAEEMFNGINANS